MSTTAAARRVQPDGLESENSSRIPSVARGATAPGVGTLLGRFFLIAPLIT